MEGRLDENKRKRRDEVEKAIAVLDKYQIHYTLEITRCDHCGYIGSSDNPFFCEQLPSGVFVSETTEPFRLIYNEDGTVDRVPAEINDATDVEFDKSFGDDVLIITRDSVELCPECGSDKTTWEA